MTLAIRSFIECTNLPQSERNLNAVRIAERFARLSMQRRSPPINDTAVSDAERARLQIKPRARLVAEPDQKTRWPPEVIEPPSSEQPASKH